MHEPRLTYLFRAYFSRTATPAEQDELMVLLAQAEHDEQLKALLEEAWQQFDGQGRLFTEHQGRQMLSNIFEAGAGKQAPIVSTRTRRGWFAMAAAVLLFAATGLYFLLKDRSPAQPITQQTVLDQASDTITPGSNKAVLTLANGARILLDSTHVGALGKQGNAQVTNLQSATLAYHAGHENSTASLYNTLSTPSGGQYQLLLSDGTRVWLNASSSIRFPASFSGKERAVALTGEAYFEVAKNTAMPFSVTVNGMKVEVLGTHFNIMAYDDEQSVNTTLLEGSVRVQKGPLHKILVPGQESRLQPTGGLSVAEADLEEVMAWKNGWFQFNAYDIQKIMRQIVRWYDVQIVYAGKIPGGHFTGMVSRENNIAQVLKILQAGGVDFRIEGKKVVVLDNHFSD